MNELIYKNSKLKDLEKEVVKLINKNNINFNVEELKKYEINETDLVNSNLCKIDDYYNELHEQSVKLVSIFTLIQKYEKYDLIKIGDIMDEIIKIKNLKINEVDVVNHLKNIKMQIWRKKEQYEMNKYKKKHSKKMELLEEIVEYLYNEYNYTKLTLNGEKIVKKYEEDEF